jgi:hypothetical protein
MESQVVTKILGGLITKVETRKAGEREIVTTTRVTFLSVPVYSKSYTRPATLMDSMAKNFLRM